MSDLDPLEGFTREARRGVVPPDFDALAQVSRRRRRTTVLASGVAVAAVVAIVGVGVRVGYDDQSAPIQPSHTGQTTQTPRKTETTTAHSARSLAERVVDNPHSLVRSMALLPDRTQARAVVWSARTGPFALAVTDDGFATRTCFLLHGIFPSVSAVGPDWFFVDQEGGVELVSPTGEIRPVQMGRTPAPVLPGEYLASARSKAVVAVDPAHATAHPVLLPPHASGAYGTASLLWSIVSTGRHVIHGTIVWSTDGGRTWSSHDLGNAPLGYYSEVPSMPGTMAVSEGGEDNDMPPLSHLVESTDGGTIWHTFDIPIRRALPENWTAALPDGRLLASVPTDGGPAGLVRSSGTDWTHLVPVHPVVNDGEPLTGDMFDGNLTTSTNHGSLVLSVANLPGRRLLMSEDGGSTWSDVRDR
jgi:hypothetical protein